MEPDLYLKQGAPILAEKLEPLGYEFAIVEPPIRGSGGVFAWGAFRRQNRQVRLWARYDRLGGVLYVLNSDEFSHQDYMRALGLAKDAEWPGFDDGDLFGGFRRLARDLDNCEDFLSGDAAAVLKLVRSLPPKKTGFHSLNK